jgi:hypothetical protein
MAGLAAHKAILLPESGIARSIVLADLSSSSLQSRYLVKAFQIR